MSGRCQTTEDTPLAGQPKPSNEPKQIEGVHIWKSSVDDTLFYVMNDLHEKEMIARFDNKYGPVSRNP